jgi:hypothetical protein
MSWNTNAKALTIVVDRKDGRTLNGDEVADALEAAGYHVAAMGQGDRFLAEGALRRAVEAVDGARNMLKGCAPRRNR